MPINNKILEQTKVFELNTYYLQGFTFVGLSTDYGLQAAV